MDIINAIRPSSRYARTTSPTRTDNPSGIDSTVMTPAWNSSDTTSRRDRPSSSASRLTGVTRLRSITPARSSASSVKPTKNVPNRASSTRRPGTNTLYASAADGARSALVSKGPNSRR